MSPELCKAATEVNLNEKITKNLSDWRTKANEKIKPVEYAVGDLVLVKRCNGSNAKGSITAKFLLLYEDPYRVCRRLRPCTYQLQFTDASVRGNFHVSLLKRYHEQASGKEKAETEGEETGRAADESSGEEEAWRSSIMESLLGQIMKRN